MFWSFCESLVAQALWCCLSQRQSQWKTKVISRKYVIVPQTRYFLRLVSWSQKKRKGHRTMNSHLKKKKVIASLTHCFLHFVGSLQKNCHCTVLDVTSPQKKNKKTPELNLVLHFLQWKNGFALVKNLCKNARNYFALFCACRKCCYIAPAFLHYFIGSG